MEIVMLGATGRIGRQVVQSALARGHRVVAVTRSPQAMTGQENVTVVAGDVFEPDSLRKPMVGADAVIFAVGTPGRGPTIVRSTGIVAVAKAMAASGVSRLVVLSPSGVVISPRAPLSRKIALRFFVHKLCHNRFNDVERMEDELRYTDIDWSVVRAPTLRDGPATGRYRVLPAEQVGRERPVSVADLADFVVTHAADASVSHDIVSVTGTA